MRYLEIAGGKPLSGEITIQGSKNAALPVLAAALLGEGPCVIENCPGIRDVEDTLAIIEMLGCKTHRDGTTVSVEADQVKKCEISGMEAIRIRSSILFLGALIGRMRKAVLPHPGGCAIGSRPIGFHLEALQALGVSFSEQHPDAGEQKRIFARAEYLHGGEIHLAVPSVGATENSILAAVLADGETVIENAALEPEVEALCQFLNRRGADIARKTDGRIRIRGKRTLSPVRFRLNADRIVAGSYLLATAACGGGIRVRNLPVGELGALLQILEQMGVCVSRDGTVYAGGQIRAVDYVETAPYPGFPTDLQSPLMAALCLARGKSRIRETIFESRFKTAKQLRRMGARIVTDGSCAVIDGGGRLNGAELCTPDLRGGAALVAAALAASGRSTVSGYEYIARGYEDICRDFRSLGADISMKQRQ
ncbi:MAG: UDP-N-acetylglucosamine 1-carboxyvinyltransferase [Lachnospiraceae bacterium]|nr:UDP-N-acetylglucosamine 1-carboxyvinyltransferase [Lachnospiraceae bacterium]